MILACAVKYTAFLRFAKILLPVLRTYLPLPLCLLRYAATKESAELRVRSAECLRRERRGEDRPLTGVRGDREEWAVGSEEREVVC